MRLAWLTDIHLDFLEVPQVQAFTRLVAGERPDAVLLTGDITIAELLEEHLLGLAESWQVPIYFVLGNHDFYGSSISAVRESARALRERSAMLRWLPSEGVVALTDKTALVGHDGWPDARLGDYDDTRINMRDWSVIEDLKGFDRDGRRAVLQRLGDEAAQHLREVLGRALETHDEVIVATHPPLFPSACRYFGLRSPPRWLPHLTCAVAGEVVRRVAAEHRGKSILCLAGHTHGRARETIAENVRAWTGTADYGAPAVELVLDLARGFNG